MSKHILTCNNVKLQNIVYDDFIKNDTYASSKIWYQETLLEAPKSLLVQSEYLTVDDVTKINNIILALKETTFYENLDKLTLEFMQKQNIIKQLKIKNVTYRTIINQIDDDVNTNYLKIKIQENTQFFLMNEKKILKYDDVKKMLKKGTKVKIIIEFESIIIDLKNSEIFINMTLKQMLIQKLRPVKIELSEYSFIESESDTASDEQTNVADINPHYVLNNHTEYLNEETEFIQSSDSETQSKSDVTSDEYQNTKQNITDSESFNSSTDESSDNEALNIEKNVDNFLKKMKNNKNK